MPSELRDWIEPASTALLAIELKRVTVGDLQGSSAPGAPGNPLGAVAEQQGTLAKLARLARSARAAGVRVVHCTAAFRPDGAGSPGNAPLLASALRHRARLLLGSPEAQPVRELGPEPEDLVSVRLHGVAPFVGTELDPLLRSLGIRSVVLVGGSVNVGIVGACVEAVDFGYRVIIPRDGVIGVPEDYVDAVFEHTLKLLARVTRVDELIDVWKELLGARAR
jgi:nicotinamidase-related amidase